jgi:D-alanine-D-alanine ligase
MDKHLSKVVYKEAGIDTPQWMVLRRSDVSDGVISSAVQWLGFPMMVKPCSQGSSVGMTKAKDRQELTQAIERAFEFDSRIMLEEFISGREITGGVLGNDDLTALPIVEIVPSEGYAFFDYEAKYKEGATKEICPAELPDDLTLLAQDMALRAHRALNLSGYSRTDMLLSKKGRLYSIETNTIPGMTPTSLFPQAAAAYGIDFSQLLDRLIELGLERKGRRP